jgi:integrase
LRLGRSAYEPHAAAQAFNLALDSKLRACDFVALRVDDVALNGRVRSRGAIMQRKTGQPVQFEITEQTREAVGRWLEKKDLHKGEPLFPSRINRTRPMTGRQYARLLASWLRRTKASMIYRRTGNLRAVQLLLGHTKIESTVRYLGIDVDDALLIAEQVEIQTQRRLVNEPPQNSPSISQQCLDLRPRRSRDKRLRCAKSGPYAFNADARTFSR